MSLGVVHNQFINGYGSLPAHYLIVSAHRLFRDGRIVLEVQVALRKVS
jgi:hypothetical protein